MSQPSDADVRKRAKQNFEREHPGRRWDTAGRRERTGSDTVALAGLQERQEHLARAHIELKAEAAQAEA